MNKDVTVFVTVGVSLINVEGDSEASIAKAAMGRIEKMLLQRDFFDNENLAMYPDEIYGIKAGEVTGARVGWPAEGRSSVVFNKTGDQAV